MHKSGEGLVVMNRGSKKRPTGLKGGRRKKGVQVALPRAEETRGAVLCIPVRGACVMRASTSEVQGGQI